MPAILRSLVLSGLMSLAALSSCKANSISETQNGVTECTIDGTTYPANASNPDEPCKTCQPDVSVAGWTDAPEGAICGAGQVCHEVSCQRGCYIERIFFAAVTPNPANACQLCAPETSTSAWGAAANGSTCGAGRVCNGGSCASGCAIGGAVYSASAANPANACQLCDPATRATDWTLAPDGAPCGNGQLCSGGACGARCDIGGQIVTSGATNPQNACQTCQPGVSTTSWTALAAGASCATGSVCNQGSCVAGCAIGGAVYAADAANPTNACQVCKPGSSTAAWTAVADGAACGAGAVCGGGACVAGCFIGGAVHASGDSGPSGSCQTCDPTKSTTAWSSVADGTSCGNAQICVSGVCGSSCSIGGTIYASGATSPSNPCLTCQPGSSTVTWTTSAAGSTCGVGQVCSGTSCNTACYIGGSFYTANQPNPADSCQQCMPATSTGAWTTVAADGAACGTGHVCKTGRCISGCYIGGVVYSEGAANPLNACQTCQPGASATGWSNLHGTKCGSGAWQWCFNGTCGSTPPSCAPGGAGMSSCGSAADSCCSTLSNLEGSFDRTYVNTGPGATGQADPVTVSAIFLDKYETTVGRFRQFVSAWGGDWRPPAGSGKHTDRNGGQGLADSGTPGAYEAGWNPLDVVNVAPMSNLGTCGTYTTWTSSAGANENKPINCVNWYEAYAFCIWDGGFLPSEAEWEGAAGGLETFEYPWGFLAPGTANKYAIYGDGTGQCYYPGPLAPFTGAANFAPVGTPLATNSAPGGHMDMAGNVREWTMDWYAPYVSPCTDCANLTNSSSALRVNRGGSTNGRLTQLMPTNRYYGTPSMQYADVGIRCARVFQ